jgi:arylsulfatase A-like enzyme
MTHVRGASVPSNLHDVFSDMAAGTVRIGRESRPAHLVEGPQRVERSLSIPVGGATLDLALGPVRRSVTLRVLAGGVELASIKALPDQWTPVRIDLPYSLRPVHLVEELRASPEALVFWSDDQLVRKWPTRSRPDVVVISLDTVRPDYLTPYNHDKSSSPALATFAEEATRFDQAISVSSWTLPAHEAVFTGAYPKRDDRLDAGELTLAEAFASAGYETFGMSGGPFLDAAFGFQRGFASYFDSIPGKHAKDTTTWALDRMAQASKATPVFAFLNYFDAHEPNTGVATAEWQAMDSREYRWTPDAVARIRAAYRQDVRSLDHEVGRLFDGLKRIRDWNNTLVIVFGDHGQLLGERGMVGHGFRLDEELIHVPLMIKAPLEVHLPPHYADQVQLTDVFPLALELAGILSDRETSRVDRIVRGIPIRALTFAEVRHEATPTLLESSQWVSESLQLVRTDTLRAMRDAEGRRTLASTDDATRSLDDSSMPSLFHELGTFEHPTPPPSVPNVRRDVLKRLRALGYIR